MLTKISRVDLAMEFEHKNPARLGFRMPAEWEAHEGTWLTWPSNPITWPQDIKQVQQSYLQAIRELSLGEKVFLIVNHLWEEKSLKATFHMNGTRFENIYIFRIPNVDVWIRDYGPNFIKHPSGEVAFNRWFFNAWGNKYEDLKLDNSIPDAIEKMVHFKKYVPDFVLEGGSIEVNGEGVCLTTEQCLLHPNRNPRFSKYQIDRMLQNYLGVSKVIWLKEGIEGDDTDGHIDDIARFVNPRTILCAYEEDESDPNYHILSENYLQLLKEKDVRGSQFKVVKLPMPGYVIHEETRLPASYANFYIGNSCVLVPTFRHHNDAKALSVIKEFFPNRRVVGIDCRVWVRGLGTLHCSTQQQPMSQNIPLRSSAA